MNTFSEGNLVNETITENQSNFSLKGMLCPCFQNLGSSDVMFNGLILQTGDSYVVNVPTVVLKNEIDIRFLSNTGRKFVVSYVRLDNNF